MTDEQPIKAFAPDNAFFGNMVGIGFASAAITELMPPEGRPIYVLGAQGWRGQDWGTVTDEQWILSWQTMAILHGALDALRLELPEGLRHDYARVRRDTVPDVRANLVTIADVFRRAAGAE